MRLRYCFDKIYDEKLVYEMLKSQNGELGLRNMAKQMHVNLGVAREIHHSSSYKIALPIIKALSNKVYEEQRDKRYLAKHQYQESWDKINNQFFERLAEVTYSAINYPEYECVLSPFHIGISNWGGNKIVRSWLEDPNRQRRITAHEIIIAHFFALMQKRKVIVDELEIWKLAEILAFILTGLDPIMTSFWPWDHSGAYTDHNYPGIVEEQKRLTQIYTRGGFKDFLRESLKE